VIDLRNEQVVSLTEATQHLPRRRAGRKPAVQTLYRWASPGCRGVQLEVIQVGGTLCTSLEALQRFCEALSDAKAARGSGSGKSGRHEGRSRSAEDVDRQLAAEGFNTTMEGPKR
jgi:hypothetical protein